MEEVDCTGCIYSAFFFFSMLNIEEVSCLGDTENTSRVLSSCRNRERGGRSKLEQQITKTLWERLCLFCMPREGDKHTIFTCIARPSFKNLLTIQVLNLYGQLVLTWLRLGL